MGYSVTFERQGQDLLIHTRVRPGGGPPPHVHPNGDEHFILESGSVEFLLGRRKTMARAGETVVVPRGTRHTFKNVGSGEAVFRAEVRPDMSGRARSSFARQRTPDSGACTHGTGSPPGRGRLCGCWRSWTATRTSR